jgi:uncharacterized protein (TIRG00374 family)
MYMHKPSKPAYRFAIAAIILAVTFYGAYHVLTTSVDLSKVRDLIHDIPVPFVVAMLALSTALMVIRALRFFLLLKDAGIDLTFWQALKIYMAGQALSPLPGGEGSRTALLKMECGARVSDAVTPLIVLGISEMIVAVIITIIGSVFLNILRLAAAIALVGISGLIWLLVNHQVVRKLFKVLPDTEKVEKAEAAIESAQKEVKGTIFEKKSWHPSETFIHSLVLAFITDAIGGAIVYLVAYSFKLPVSYLFSLYVFAAATVLGELVPFSPGGVGPTEGGMTGILLLAGLALPQSVAVVLIFRGATLVYSILIGMVFLLAFYPRKYLRMARKK